MAAKATTEKGAKKKGMSRGIVIALALTVCAVTGGYIGGMVFYSSHYFPNTTVGDVSCGNRTAEYVEAKNIAGGSDYLLTVTDRKGNSYHLAGMDFGYAYNAKGEEAAILKEQNTLLWIKEIFDSHSCDMDRSFTYDAEKLKELTESLPIFSEDYIEAPENAYLDITDTGYEIVEEKNGSTPIAEQVISAVIQAVDSQQTLLSLSDDCYEAPEITADDESIQSVAAQLDSYTASTIHYEIEGADENLTAKQILSMLDIGEDGTVSLNEGKVDQYVQYLASTYNTYGDVRKFKTSKGDKIKIGGGDYGWVVSKTGEKAQILSDLAGGVPVSREPVYEQRAIQGGEDDIGDTYVEIDYTNQHLWYYKSGELTLETDIISGNVNKNNGSPDGVYKIVYCERDATLVGENYSSSVKYFMPFAYNVGIHDASWQSAFGGELYKTRGSHGCINVPEEAAEALFDIIEVGTPVIAYYREPVTLTAENARISNAYSYVSPDAE